jgi:multiple sugar transport system ATP-binding protein
MNLRSVKLSIANGRTEAVFASGIRFDLSDHRFATAPEDGASVILGLRPEHFVVGAGTAADSAATFEVPVQYAERTGPDASAYFVLENDLLALRVEPAVAAGLKPGQVVPVRYLKGKAHLFDAQTGQRM